MINLLIQYILFVEYLLIYTYINIFHEYLHKNKYQYNANIDLKLFLVFLLIKQGTFYPKILVLFVFLKFLIMEKNFLF